MVDVSELKNFTVDVDGDGIATFTFDVPGRTMNTFTQSAVDDLERIVAILARPDVTGGVLASGKDNAFCAGADLMEIGSDNDADVSQDAAYAASHRMSLLLRRIEVCGKPVAAALEGLALGGGFEFALVAHHRVASHRAKIGLPEVTIGLLPGGGGTQRTPRLAGVEAALDLMLTGKPIDAERAHALGLIDAIVEPGATVAAAKDWVRACDDPTAPWDRKGYVTAGGPYTPQGNAGFVARPGAIKGAGYGNYPAEENIARCVYEGFGLPMDVALEVEGRLFHATLATPQARAMVRTLFVNRQALARGGARPEGVPHYDVRKAAVLGAGMMGAGISYVQAAAGIDTVLIDVDQDAADRGKDYSRTVSDKAVAQQRMTRENADALLARILPTTDFAASEGSDIVIEAVFEDRAIKADVTRRVEPGLAPTAVLASNTSTLPIDGLADAAERPENVIGIHFFSPVDRMELVEVIVGKRTARETLAKALDYCRKIKKVPIVVHDRRGFYTSRVFETYNEEGIELLIEGVAPAIIDNVGRMTGMPRGPLELLDDVAIDLVDRVYSQKRRDEGRGDPNGGPDKVYRDMVLAGRLGRKNRKGFYDYPDSGKKMLWPGLADMHPVRTARSSPELIETIKRRLLYRQAIEAARCLDEGVIDTPRDGDVGATLGWSFAKWTGGPFSLIDAIGVSTFVTRCDDLASTLGDRFAPPPLLRDMASAGTTFYGATAR